MVFSGYSCVCSYSELNATLAATRPVTNIDAAAMGVDWAPASFNVP